MIAARRSHGRRAKLLSLERGRTKSATRARRISLRLFRAGDLVVANDAATLPASLSGRHAATGAPVELRLAGWVTPGDPTRFVAVVFGAGDRRTRTEDRPPPPRLAPGRHARARARSSRPSSASSAIRASSALRFAGTPDAIWAGIAQHGRPIQYSHVRRAAARSGTCGRRSPRARSRSSRRRRALRSTGACSPRFAKRGIGFATLTHAAGISSTGDPALDASSRSTSRSTSRKRPPRAIARTKARGGRIIAIGTTVVRALEAAAEGMCAVHAGDGVATGRIGPEIAAEDRRRDRLRRARAGRKPFRAAPRLRRRRLPRARSPMPLRRTATAITSSAIPC